MIQQVCLFLGSIDRLERVVYKSAKLLRIAVNGQTAFLQGFGYFQIFYIFPHIFGVYDPIFKIFSVLDIKIKFPVV